MTSHLAPEVVLVHLDRIRHERIAAHGLTLHRHVICLHHGGEWVVPLHHLLLYHCRLILLLLLLHNGGHHRLLLVAHRVGNESRLPGLLLLHGLLLHILAAERIELWRCWLSLGRLSLLVGGRLARNGVKLEDVNISSGGWL